MGKQGSKTQHARSELRSLAKIPTSISGLDDILEGGFPAGRTTLISGGPGTGKTMLGLEFLYKSALAGNFEQIDFSGIGFSSLIDTIILLRFVEVYNKIARSLLILKSRGTKHSNSYHRFVITDHGIEMSTIPNGARLSELQGQPSTGRSHVEAAIGKGGGQ